MAVAPLTLASVPPPLLKMIVFPELKFGPLVSNSAWLPIVMFPEPRLVSLTTFNTPPRMFVPPV